MADLRLGQEYEVLDMPEDRLKLSAAMFGEGDLAVDLTIRLRAPELSHPQRTLVVRVEGAHRERSTGMIFLYGVLMEGPLPFEATHWARVTMNSGVAMVCIQDHPPRIEF